MALKSTIYKLQLQLADMDRARYADHALTLALHPSETEERLMVRVLAFALLVPADDHDGALVFARGLSDADEPDLWRHSLDGRLRHWVEVGQPDERRLTRACGRADRVTIFTYGSSAGLWWAGLGSRVARLRNLEVWQLPPAHSQALAALAERSMSLQISVQDGTSWVVQGEHSAEVQPQPLTRAAAAAAGAAR
ncbi:MAG: YaeQ family protein [Rubrivivax sp.]